MYPICSPHDMNFCSFIEKTSLVFKNRFEKEYYSSADKISGYDEFTTDDVKFVVSFCRSFLMSRSHDHIFCSAMRYGSWLRAQGRTLRTRAMEVNLFENENVAMSPIRSPSSMYKSFCCSKWGLYERILKYRMAFKCVSQQEMQAGDSLLVNK